MNETVAVLFRVWKPSRKNGEPGGGVIAIFPTIPTDQLGYRCEMFEHIGQHGGGDPLGVIAGTRQATETECAALRKELEASPYNYHLRVCKRMSRAMREECMREARAQARWSVR